MMGPRAKMKGGEEYDALTRWRRFRIWKAGMRPWAKRKFRRRERHEAKLIWQD